jgi:hypothetical protein
MVAGLENGVAHALRVVLGLGRIHPLYARFANIFGTSIVEATMRPNPRWSSPTVSARTVRRPTAPPGRPLPAGRSRAEVAQTPGVCRRRRQLQARLQLRVQMSR